jgi:flagellar protein FlaI
MAENDFSVNLDSKTVFFGHDGELSDTVSFSIQSYNRGNVSPVELIQSGMFSADEMGYLWEMMSYGGNIVVGGGTHVGKSITLNAIGNFIPVNQRVVSVEEQREVELDHPYWTPMTSDEETPIPEVIKKSLRVRPDYVLFDEIRSRDESNVLFEAAMTGHSIVFTMHAPSVEECLTRLSLPPIDISGSQLSTIDVIIRLSEYAKDGDSINRCSEIVEPAENWNGELDTVSTTSICEWDSHTDSHTADPSKSILLREIAESQLTSGETIVQRIMLRSDILSYMAEEDLDSPSDITDVVTEYDSDPEIQSTISRVGIGEWVAQSINESESNDNVTSTS